MNESRPCTAREPDLIALLDGELGQAAKAELERHLAGCESCRQELAEIQSTSAFMRRWELAEPPRDLVPAMAKAQVSRLTLPGKSAWHERWLAAGVGALAAAAALVLVLKVGGLSAGNQVKEIHALAAEVTALRAELQSAESALAAAKAEQASAPVPAPAPAANPVAPVVSAPDRTPNAQPPDRGELLRQVAALIAESESRQDTKFLFTTDQLARSMAMQRREDLTTIERQLRDARAETFQALVTTHERLDRLAQPAVLEQPGMTPGDEETSKRSPDGQTHENQDRLEPRW
jgi:hypothetical protein